MKRETNGQTSQTAGNNATTKAKKTRTIGFTSYEDMLAEDVRSAKRARDEDVEWMSEPSIVLGTPMIKSIRVSSLGPILKKRFIHPGLN